MREEWILSLMWISMVLPSSVGLKNLSGDYTGYGSLVRVRRKAADSTQLWPDGLVPYTFLEPQPSRSIIMSGLSHWEEHTCIRFTPVNNTDFPHLQFRRLSGCRSGVGIEGTSGQNVSIGDNCNKLGIVVHEIGHALGFYHEIRRPDRDDHVIVNEDNILKDELFNFYKLHWLDISIKYDLSSVMHYNPLEWSANERTTVATKDPMLQGIIGRWKQETDLGLSHRDKLLANTIYGCLDQWLGKCNLNRNPCKNEGYLSEACTCICAPGTTGRTCETTIGGYYDDLKSPCSLEVKYPTYISSPNYPLNYDADTWCVYRLKGEECQAPEVEIIDFQLGPRSHRNQCFHDYLEIRNNTLYNGFIKCGTDVARGTKWVSSGSTMILYFKGSEGGHRGFKAKVGFNPIPGCCRTHANSSAYFLHTPGYPHPYEGDFNCSYSITAEAPARVVVTVTRKTGSKTDDHWTCALKLCQPHGRCHRHCRGVIADGFSKHLPKEVILPNVASIHYMQYSGDYSPFSSENAAFQVGFTLEDSPCHRIIIVNRTEPRGYITVGPRFFELLQCEWWFQAPRGSHVKVTLKDLHLPVHEDSYLAVNEAGEATYPRETTRVYHDFDHTPKTFVSLEYKLAIVLQGDFITEVSFKYELYDCIDTDDECEYWAANDECEKNPLWMKINCKKSCAVCDYSSVCEDQHNECGFWATHEQCKDNRIWMNAHCKKSCGYCDLCWDANPQCPEWAEMGDCEGNPSYMDQFCRRSCGLCGDFETTSTAVKSTGNLSVTSTPHPPKSTTTNKSREPNKPDKQRTINQTFKLNKNKLKRYRDKSSKPSKDRINRYKHNNVMIPPYDDDDEEYDAYGAKALNDSFRGEKNLKRPFDTGGHSNGLNKKHKRKKASTTVPKYHQTPKLHRSRTSSPNTRIGNYKSKKRKHKINHNFQQKNLTEERKDIVLGETTQLVALPLTLERNESVPLVNQSLLLNVMENTTKANSTKQGDIFITRPGNYEKIKQDESAVICQEDSNCISLQMERPFPGKRRFNQTHNKIPRIGHSILQGKHRKFNRTKVSSKRVRKQNRTVIKKRKRNKNKKRCKKNRGMKIMSPFSNSRENGTRKYIWQNSKERLKPSDNQRGKKRRRKNKPLGKGRKKNRCRGSKKQSRRRNKGPHDSDYSKPGRINETTPTSMGNVEGHDVVSTTVYSIEHIDPLESVATPPATTILPDLPQPTSTMPSIINEELPKEIPSTTELDRKVTVTTVNPADDTVTEDALQSIIFVPIDRTSVTSTTVSAPIDTKASHFYTTMNPDIDNSNVSESISYGEESNSIVSSAKFNVTSSYRKRYSKRNRRFKKGSKSHKLRRQQRKNKTRSSNHSSRRSRKRKQEEKGLRNMVPETNLTQNSKQSMLHKRRKKHRDRKRKHDSRRPSHRRKIKADFYKNQTKDRDYIKPYQNRSSPYHNNLYIPEEALIPAFPPAPTSTSIIPSPEGIMISKAPETQAEMRRDMHEMLKTEPETEAPDVAVQITGYGMMSPVSKTEMDKIVSTESPLELDVSQVDRPPKRSPEKYAEWGIGPVKSPHQTGRRPRPRWKYRRSFYRRDHIYEDIWPLFDGTANGKKR